MEAKFQLSLKLKLWKTYLGTMAMFGWLYPSSLVSLYISMKSRPFRETNYEPEASFFRTNYELFGLNGAY